MLWLSKVVSKLHCCSYAAQAWFYVGAGGGQKLPPPRPEPCPPNVWLQQQYAVVKPANSYTGGVFGGLEWLIW